jgi:glycosidase
VGESISLKGAANKPSTMKWFLNGVEIANAAGATSLVANPTLTTTGTQTVVLEANDGSSTKSQSFTFFVAPAPNILPLPAGVRDGINYEAGNTSVVLVLNAPNKTRVSVIGEFPGSNWTEQSAYVMNKTPDGNYWWLRITGLTPGQEYAFQYLVNGSLKVGEPYAEKILDPWNDGSISASTYPSLKPYPAGQSGIVSIVQTNAPGYAWTNNTFNRPDKRNLVIYELLLRDYLDAHDWNTLRDTLGYLKRLGVNAIEIMPFNEFEGNESWGYNPDYFLAPDKYYGPKNSLKRFIDSCHSNGIAVIMDIALNHTTGLNPLAQLYWNAATNQPAADNPWLNVNATHPFNVFNDFNHESLRTRYFTSRVIEHWLQEYKLDGFRFDLSKGFTQVNSGSDVNLWSQYDASRVAIWKRYYDTCQLKSAGSYVILEHFAVNNEEIELADYGMLFWGNLNYNFNEASMGWVSTSNFENYLHAVRGWSKAHLVGYMESHDEERLMYKNMQFGNTSNPAHNVRDLHTSLKRVELCAAFFLAGPGPKMLWEFGELGYDFSINRCVDGSVNNNCRLDKKPIRWDYQNVVQRKRVFDIYSAMNKLRFHGWYKDVFIANNVNITRNLAPAIKSLTVRSANDTSVLFVVGNFEVTAQTAPITLPVAGTWYNYLQGGTFTATGSAQNITLQPGEYMVLLNRNLVNAVVTPVVDPVSNPNTLQANVYPNPVNRGSGFLEVYQPQAGLLRAWLLNASGQRVKEIYSQVMPRGKQVIHLDDKLVNLSPGLYYIRMESGSQSITLKTILQ